MRRIAEIPDPLAPTLPMPFRQRCPKMRNDMILIVEDDPIARRALQSLFATNGYPSRAVPSAEDALEVLHKADHPGLVLIDIDLPGMNGLDLLTQLQHEFPKLNCTLMSANDHALTRSGYRAVPFFAKPLDLRRLLTFLRDARPPGLKPAAELPA
jgi:DNA-binding NtrC family response regulator